MTASPLFLVVDRDQVEDKWRVHALCDAGDAALETEAVMMATCICTLLLEACFGEKAMETWVLTEAKEAAQLVTWNLATQRVESLPNEAQAAINAPLCGLDVKLQAWETLDNFDTPDRATSTDQDSVVFELANHFFLAPGIDFTSVKDTGSAKSFNAATFFILSACGPCFSPDQSGSVWSQHFQHCAAPCAPGAEAPNPLTC